MELFARPSVEYSSTIRFGGGNEWANLSRRLNSRDDDHSDIPWASLRDIHGGGRGRSISSRSFRSGSWCSNTRFLLFTLDSILAGAFVAAAVAFVLLSSGSAIGLAVASPSSTRRDTSWTLAHLAGSWLLLTSLASSGSGDIWLAASRIMETVITHEVEFRDGIHG